MNRKSVKLIATILTIAISLMFLTSVAFAATTGKPSEFTDLTGVKDVTGDTVGVAGKQIIKTIRTVGMIISIVIIMVLGIKYMMGSAEEKASYKKTMIPFVIGAVLLFGAAALADMIYDFAIGLGTAK